MAMRIEQRSIDLPCRILVTGDTHLTGGRTELPDALVSAAARSDLTIHTGDLCTVAAHDLFEAHGPILAVRGNNEELKLDERLPDAIELRFGDRRGIITHGHLEAGSSASNSVRRAYAARFDMVIYGHSHMPEWEEVDGTWFLNPGSPTQRRRAPSRSFAELTIDSSGAVEVIWSLLD
ncbi:MAG: metallophosphoesterase [Sphaerobacteraceae bacterium]|nr:MAG: metallophosphoesterase [Sphaerobacteraceae bacterium]